jgi:hypothetical protein
VFKCVKNDRVSFGNVASHKIQSHWYAKNMKQIQIQTAYVCFHRKTTRVYFEVLGKNRLVKRKGHNSEAEKKPRPILMTIREQNYTKIDYVS